jgi:hypothetical protein
MGAFEFPTGTGHWDQNSIADVLDPAQAAGVNASALNADLGNTVRPAGFIGGGQIGYNWQVTQGYWVSKLMQMA